MIPYSRQSITEEDIQAVTATLRSAWLTQGPVVPGFEEAIAERVGAKHAVACSSGTAALHMACEAMKVTGKRVWTSPNSFLASATAPVLAGARVGFVDIDLSTGLMDMGLLRQKLKTSTPQEWPDLVIPVHFAGNSVDMQALADLAEEYGFRVLEDAAHALGGSYKGEPVGSCRWSDACTYSFHPVKSITCGEGGMVTTNDDALAGRLRMLRSHGVTKDPSQFQLRDQPPWAYEMQALSNNYRLTDIAASLGLSQLKRLDELVAMRQEVLWRYTQLFEPPVHLVTAPDGVETAGHLAVIRIAGCSRPQQVILYETLQNHGIASQLHYIPIHTQPFMRWCAPIADPLSNSLKWAESCLSLPCYPGLSAREQELVHGAVMAGLKAAGLFS